MFHAKHFGTIGDSRKQTFGARRTVQILDLAETQCRDRESFSDPFFGATLTLLLERFEDFKADWLMTTKEPLPKQVVRFYGNADFALEAIANRQLTFVHVSKLNDPFDPYFFFETDFENKYNALLHYVNEKHPDDFTWFIQNVLQEDWDKSVNDIHSYLESQKKKTYVFSTSAPRNGRSPKR